MAIIHYPNRGKVQQSLPYTGVDPRNPSIAKCADANGYLNNPDDGNGLKPVLPYTPPDLCVGDFTITQGDCADTENKLQEENAAQVLAISGAPVNIFKYLGIHEQGKLIDLVGRGKAIGSEDVSKVYSTILGDWTSNATGINVIKQTYIGYDFGIKPITDAVIVEFPGEADVKLITAIRIMQPVDGNRAVQLRVDRSDGNFLQDPKKIVWGQTNIGVGTVDGFIAGKQATVGTLMCFATSIDEFTITFQPSSGHPQILGQAKVGKRFNSLIASFTINATSPFQVDDSLTLPIELEWKRVAIANVPSTDQAVTVELPQSVPSRYWRIVPTVFQGVTNPTAPWIVSTLEFFDVRSGPTLDDVQDTVFMENRDRDYAHSCIQIKAAYTPFDAVSDMSKFGFQIADIYTFTTTFATMVKALGRPIVVGDVIELPSELQYDHHLKPVRKFLEVTDTGWASDGYTTGWKPIIFKFQAQQLIPGQEHQTLFGNVDTQTYGLTDEQQFEGLNQQLQILPLIATERNEAEARDMVALTGIEHQQFRSAADWMGTPGTYDGREHGMENGLPPDDQPYTTGFKLPDVTTAQDRDFFRLEYDPKLQLPARLYQFSSIKQAWVHVSTDRRQVPASYSKNVRRSFKSIEPIQGLK